ncbi:hypothetical protein ABJY94_18735 [Vibrio parahaemolyticus]|uniref:hypothetical protein n=1 Tax=Vibrio parahaemolyticus TaxID=670 RepID=UPI0032AF610C
MSLTNSVVLNEFIKNNNPLLEAIQAEVNMGDLTGHGEEWEARVTIESHEADEDNEVDLEYFDAIFSVFDQDGTLVPDLQIGCYNSEGKVEKFEFNIKTHNSAQNLTDSEEFANAYKLLDLSESAIECLSTFIEQCYPVIATFKAEA